MELAIGSRFSERTGTAAHPTIRLRAKSPVHIGIRVALNPALVLARGLIEGFDQLAFDGSEFFLGQPTLAMHFSYLHQQSMVVFGRILTIAKPCSNAE